MKVVFATGIYPPDIGGPATYVEGLARAWTDADVECEVVSYASRETIATPKESSRVPVVRIDRRKSLPLRYGQFFRATFRAASNDANAIVYAQDPISAGLPAMLAARARRRPFVLKVVGDLAWEIARERGLAAAGIEEFQTLPLRGIVAKLRSVESYVARSATRVVTPSEYLKRLVVGWGVASERVEVIHNAVEESAVGKSASASLELEGQPSILTVGRLVPWKGFETVLEAFARLAAGNETAKLHIVGSGPLGSTLRRRIEEMGIGARVRMQGALDRRTLRSALARADIFVLASSYEGFSHVLLEAMREGTFVVASNAGGNPELVVDGESGLLVEPNADALADGLDRAIRDRALRSRLGERGRQRAEEFRWDAMVEQTLSLLHSVAQASSSNVKRSR